MNNQSQSMATALRWMVLGTALTAFANNAYADGDVIPHAIARYEHNSNLLLVPNDSPQKDAKGVSRLDDELLEYNGGIDVNYRWRDNRFYLITDVTHFAYQHFSNLDNNGFAGSTGLDWVATHKVKGNVSYDYNRHQLSFANVVNVDTSKAYIETTQAFRASGNYEMNSRWSTNLSGSYSTAKLPNNGTPGALSYDLHQTQERVGVTYTGASSLKSGFAIDHENGEYHDGSQPGYTRTLYELTADYKLGARTTIGGSIGYTTRAQQGMDNSTTIGSLSFNQQLTAKTSYYFQFRRSLDTYNTTVGSQLSTSGVVGFNWQATPKISISGNYDYTKAKVTGVFDTTANPPVIGSRDDTTKSANVSLKYQVLRWLAISPYYRYENRTSDIARFTFNANIYGITAEARFNP